MPPLTDIIDATDMQEPSLRAAFAFWSAVGRCRGLPLADSLELPALDRSLLPHLALVSGPDGAGRFFGLFLGSAAAIAVGRDISGRYLDEVYPPALYEGAQRLITAVADTGGPVYEDFVIGPDAGSTVKAARLGLPFFGADGRVSRILTALHYQPSPSARSTGVRVMQDRTRLHRQSARRVRSATPQA